jgi:hypothetical protein
MATIDRKRLKELSDREEQHFKAAVRMTMELGLK